MSTSFLLGATADNTPVTWDPRRDGHLAIVDCHAGRGDGATAGEPRYRSIAFGIAAAAVRAQWIVHTLSAPSTADPAAVAWRPAQTVLHKMWDDVEIRHRVLSASDLPDEANPFTPTLVVITEYARIITALRRGEGAIPAAAEHDLDRIIALGRSAGVHLLLAGPAPHFCPRLIPGDRLDQLNARYLLDCSTRHPAAAQLLGTRPAALTQDIVRIGATTAVLRPGPRDSQIARRLEAR